MGPLASVALSLAILISWDTNVSAANKTEWETAKQLLVECSLNVDCPAELACVDHRCVNPCGNVCGDNSVCRVCNHYGACVCKQNFTGDPFFGCKPIECQLPTVKVECSLNVDCPAKLACLDNRCVNPCGNLCGKNSVCRVYNHYGACVCKQNFTGDPFVGCKPIVKVECSLNADCPAELACLDNRCVDPCGNVCGNNSVCRVSNHYGACVCKQNFTGDPFVGCKPFVKVECSLNADCPAELACLDNRCVDPCGNVCGKNSDCRVSNHYGACVCKQNFTGDPFVGCEPFGKALQNSCNTKKRYHLIHEALTWEQGPSKCKALGMEYATIECKQEQEEAMRTVGENKDKAAFWSSGKTLGTDPKKYVWTTTCESILFDNWHDKYPSKDDPSCIALRWDYQLQFTTQPCDWLFYALCQSVSS